MMLDPEKHCPLLIVFGQSNAHAHATRLAPEDEVNIPMKNVYGLARKENQAYGLDHVTWSGFTTSEMNLGETQDHTCSLAAYFAKQWQAEIDAGRRLPDLYVVQISIGAQGVNEDDVEPNGNQLNMWSPDRKKVLVPGKLGTVNISLYPLAVEILKLVAQSIHAMGKEPVVLGLHWNQWETEVHFGLDGVHRAAITYQRIFRGFREALGVDYPLFLYRPLSDIYRCKLESRNFLTGVFEDMVQKSDLVQMYDLRTSTFWKENSADHGIFRYDNVHYLPEIHAWFAEQQWKYLLERGYIQ